MFSKVYREDDLKTHRINAKMWKLLRTYKVENTKHQTELKDMVHSSFIVDRTVEFFRYTINQMDKAGKDIDAWLADTTSDVSLVSSTTPDSTPVRRR